MGEFSSPFFWAPFSLFFSYPSNIEIIFDCSDIITKIHPPILKSWIRPCSGKLNLMSLLQVQNRCILHLLWEVTLPIGSSNQDYLFNITMPNGVKESIRFVTWHFWQNLSSWASINIFVNIIFDGTSFKASHQAWPYWLLVGFALKSRSILNEGLGYDLMLCKSEKCSKRMLKKMLKTLRIVQFIEPRTWNGIGILNCLPLIFKGKSFFIILPLVFLFDAF